MMFDFFFYIYTAANDETLHKAFACCGVIDYVRVLQSTKGCNGVAFVCFKDAASVINALKLHNTPIDGRNMRVNRYETNKLGARKEFAGAARRINNRMALKENSGKHMQNKGRPMANRGKPNADTAKKQNFAGVKNNMKKVRQQYDIWTVIVIS